MSDRELLELAAKAAGIEIEPHPNGKLFEHLVFIRKSGGNWNPLTDDGDALRLAVDCDFGVCLEIPKNNVRIDGPLPGGLELVNQPIGADPYAATRRAITRAAAEIGRNMK